MRFDVAIIGACAANIDTGLTVSQWDDAYVKRAVLKSAQRSILVATADKFNRTAAHKFGDVTDLDTIITTGDLSVTTIYEASQSGVEVITV